MRMEYEERVKGEEGMEGPDGRNTFDHTQT
jgi:hypothetical protein